LEDISAQLQNIVEQVLSRENIELVEFEFHASRVNSAINVFVDCSDGLTVGKCAQLNRVLSDELDAADVIPGRYRLQVSSPGLDRPLRTTRDFERNINKDAEIVFQADLEEHVVSGKIASVSQDELILSVGSSQKKISMSDIKKGKLLLPW